MTRDKQLSHLEMDRVLEKRRLDQALNAKEFSVLAGVSYSTARAWFHQPGFPRIGGRVFWSDFLEWRRARSGSHDPVEREAAISQKPAASQLRKQGAELPARALRILDEAN